MLREDCDGVGALWVPLARLHPRYLLWVYEQIPADPVQPVERLKTFGHVAPHPSQCRHDPRILY